MTNIINRFKSGLTTLTMLLLTVLTLGYYAKHQSRKRQEAERENKGLKERITIQARVINDVKQKQKAINDAYRLDDDELNQRLRDDYRD